MTNDSTFQMKNEIGFNDEVEARMILFATSSSVPEFKRLIDTRVHPN